MNTITIDKIKEKYPLHWLVWNNDYQELEEHLKMEKVSKGFLYLYKSNHDNRAQIFFFFIFNKRNYISKNY